MQVTASSSSREALWGRGRSAERARQNWRDAAASLLGIVALFAWSLDIQRQDIVVEDDHAKMAAARRAEIAEQVKYRGGEAFVGAYAGSPYTYASDVRFTKPGTDMTVRGIDWEGKPFDNPIYYGARIARWLPASALGGMIDFTHSKAYAPLETQTAQMTGTRDGKPADAVVKLDSLFHKLEFTHGHNMLTLNALLRLPFRTAFLSPYVGIGGGASLPHTEVQFKGGARTYEYQYTGPALQFVAGLELRVPRLSYFMEYKFSFADYRAPLQNRDGGWIVFDLMNQFSRWWSGRPPEGGWAETTLVSHQLIGGMGYRMAPAAVAGP